MRLRSDERNKTDGRSFAGPSVALLTAGRGDGGIRAGATRAARPASAVMRSRGRHGQNATGRALASAARRGHRACIDTPAGSCLHRDRRHVLAVRPIGRAFGCDLLYGLCCEDERPSGAAGDLRVQWRAGRGLRPFFNLGLVGPRIAVFGMAGHDGAHVRLTDNPDTWLAFTDLVIIDPVGTGWSRAAKPDGASAFWSVHRDAEVARQGDRALCRQERPRQLAEIHPGRKLWRLPRRQGRQAICRATRASSVTGILMVSPMIEGAFHFGGDRFALGAALQLPSLAAAELERYGHLQQGGAGAGRAFRADRLSHHARRPAAAAAMRRKRSTRGSRRSPDCRRTSSRAIARLHPRRLCQEPARRASTRSSATTM